MRSLALASSLPSPSSFPLRTGLTGSRPGCVPPRQPTHGVSPGRTLALVVPTRATPIAQTQHGSGMEGGEPPAKKRGSERQITQDDPLSDEDNEPKGTWSTAPADVLAQRRVVSVKRKPKPTVPVEGVSNPFAGVSLFGAPKPVSTAPADQPKKSDGGEHAEESNGKSDDKEGQVNGKDGQGAAAQASEDDVSKPAAAAPPLFGSFKTSASQNPFAFAAATSGTASGFSTFGASAPNSLAPPDDDKEDKTEVKERAAEASGEDAGGTFSFSTVVSSGATSSIFPPVSSVFGTSSIGMFGGTAPVIGLSGGAKSAPAAVLSEEKQVTGEEEEAVGFAAEATLYEFDESKTWKERGKGEIRINLAASGQARFVMRQRGNYRLLLNANLWPGINVAMMDGGKGVTFAIVNCAAPSNAVHEVAEGASDPAKLSTYGVRFKAKDHVTEFCSAVDRHKHGGKSNGKEEEQEAPPPTGEDAT